jgi:hypothetical protein
MFRDDHADALQVAAALKISRHYIAHCSSSSSSSRGSKAEQAAALIHGAFLLEFKRGNRKCR